jgi:dTDP-L-rhamnose 4-epimerase
MKKILITGGAGFIGSNLALTLVQKGHKVRVLDNLSKQIHGENPLTSPLYLSIKDKVDFVLGSVNSKSDLQNALVDIDTIVHFAAETGTGQSMYEIQKYCEVNISGTAILLDIIANESLPIKKIIVASSRAVYGEGKYICPTHGIIYPKERLVQDLSNRSFEPKCNICNTDLTLQATDEISILHPTSIYGITKLNQEQMVLTMCKSLGISGIAFRYQNVYGPGQSLSNPYTGILSIFSTRIRNNKGINIFEDGLESRDFVFIDDIVNATISGIEIETPICEAINVGSGISTSVLTIAEKLQELLNIKVETQITGQFRLGDIRHNFADISKLNDLLFYKPTVNLELGMTRFINWVKKEEIMADGYEKSLEQLKNRGLLK